MDLSLSEAFDDFTDIFLGEKINFNRFDANSINEINSDGWTVLMYACHRGWKEAVKGLKAKGAELKSGRPDISLLQLAISSGEVEIIDQVFSKDELEVPDRRGWTPLFFSVFYGRIDCVNYLLQHGSDPNAVDILGQKPIHIALKYQMENIASLLKGNLSAPTIPISPKTVLVSNSPSPCKQTGKINDLFQAKRTFTPSKKSLHAEIGITPRKKGTPGKSSSRVLPVSPLLLSPMGPWFGETRVNLSPKMKRELLLPPQHQPQPPAPASCPSLLAFLEDLGLGKYWPIFRDEEVDFETFVTFEEQNLKEIGISLYGPRRKIALALEEYRECHGNKARLLKCPSWMQQRKDSN